MRKSGIGKLYSFNFPKRKNEIKGIVLDFNEEWTLIKRIYDYSVDGYTVFRNYKVEALQGDSEKLAAKMLKLKGYSHLKEPEIPIGSFEEIFTYADRKHKLIQLDMLDGRAFDVVKYRGVANGLYLFDELTSRAKWRYKLKLAEEELRYISFANDYLNSLKLVTKFKK